MSTTKVEHGELDLIGRSRYETCRVRDRKVGGRAVGEELDVREDGGQWHGECGRRGSRRVGGQRDYKEACGRSVGVSKEARVMVIGTGDGNN